MFIDLITHGYWFNQIMVINSITLNLYICRITLYHLKFSRSFIIFKYPGWGISHLGPILQLKFH